MNKILVPTDFSTEAENALKVAAQIARKHNSSISILHMLELPMDLINPVMGTRTNELPEVVYFIKLAEKRLSELIDQDYMQGIKVQQTIQLHRAFDGIIETSRNEGCELIVMGSKGASGMKEIFIGSNTEKVVRNSEIPVLVIKNEHPRFNINTFAFAVEFTRESKEIMTQVFDFARFMQAKLHLVYINTDSSSTSSGQIEAEREEFLKGLDPEEVSVSVYESSSAEEGILQFAREINADLIGVATHGRKGLSHFFNGSISEDLVNHAKRPVVTFRLKSAPETS